MISYFPKKILTLGLFTLVFFHFVLFFPFISFICYFTLPYKIHCFKYHLLWLFLFLRYESKSELHFAEQDIKFYLSFFFVFGIFAPVSFLLFVFLSCIYLSLGNHFLHFIFDSFYRFVGFKIAKCSTSLIFTT